MSSYTTPNHTRLILSPCNNIWTHIRSHQLVPDRIAAVVEFEFGVVDVVRLCVRVVDVVSEWWM